ncbi:MAG: hypothetical protein ACLQVI_07255 [Polyangiaceae bacterium]
MKKVRAVAVLVGLAAPVALTEACGARTGLFPFYGEGEPDAAISNDAPFVVPEDASVIDDVVLPPLDVNARDVVPQVACADASDTLIYTVTTDQTGTNFRILRFDPSSATFTDIGALVCPDPYEPFSMAVDRVGNAYVLYYDEAQASSGIAPPGNIYRVDLNTAACEPTTYVPNAQFQSFGMAFSADDTGGGETLYIASNDSNPNETTLPPGFLGAIDETTLALTDVGTFTPTVTEAELTGTGDGRLFGFWAPNGPESPGSAIVQINKTNAAIISQQLLPTVTQGNGWAFGFWGGDFYLFTNPGGITGGDTTSIVQRYDPTTGTVTQVASYPQTIVGAGVSTCAPVQ